MRLAKNIKFGERMNLQLSFAKTKNAFEMIGMRSACNIVTRTKFQGVAEFWRTSVSRKKQTCSVGGRPTGVKARSPLAWVASAEDNKADEADRQSHLKGW
jgi:hypothetical protein